MAVVRHKAAIHSGHFMVSDFEPDEQDEEEPNVQANDEGSIAIAELKSEITQPHRTKYISGGKIRVSINEGKDKEISLKTLFKSMSIAYRQRLTSPRWNRFRGLKLRWKDKIRMNNVIWRCWHMQFMKNDPRSLCAFANPLEIDNHNKTEGTTVLEGKYWKRKLETIKNEYSSWRKHYHKQHEFERKHYAELNTYDFDLKSPSQLPVEGSKDDVDLQSMLNDEGMIVDLLLNTFQETNSAENSGKLSLNRVFRPFGLFWEHFWYL